MNCRAFFSVLLLVPVYLFAYTTVMNTGFETGGLSGWWNDGNGGAVVSSDAHSGSQCVKYTVGGPSGGLATHLGVVNINAFREFYVRFWVKYGPGVPCSNCTSGGRHFWRFTSVAGPQMDTNLFGDQFCVFFYGNGGWETGHYVSQSWTSGRWYQWVIRGNLESAPGRADGNLVVSVDGRRYFDEHNSNIAGGWTGGFDAWVFTNYDFTPGAYWLVDDVLLVTGSGAYTYQEPGDKDTIPPYTASPIPGRNATNVSSFPAISIQVKDDGSGVDTATVVMKVKEQPVRPTFSSVLAGYVVRYVPNTTYSAGETIRVSIDAKDNSGNVMKTDSYYFVKAGTLRINGPASPPSVPHGIRAGNLHGSAIEISLSMQRPGPFSLDIMDLRGQKIWTH